MRDARDPAGMVVGIVNNMSPAALRSTERQYRCLLGGAALGENLKLRFFALPDQLSKAADTAADVARNYEGLDGLWDARLDALIVTGAEPQAAAMMDEPYWPVLARLVDWARDHTISTIWSCMAAHAAVLKMDGLVRRPFAEKLTGVFECAKVSDHALMANSPPSWPVPHSRHNGLDEAGLVASGYSILSRAPRVGPDIFVKQVDKSLFAFLQGHPEYDPQTLLREYRRDVRRFLAGERQDYPELPECYFGQSQGAALQALRRRVSHMDSAEFISEMDAIFQVRPQQSWGAAAAEFFADWLSYVRDRRMPRHYPAKAPASQVQLSYG